MAGLARSRERVAPINARRVAKRMLRTCKECGEEKPLARFVKRAKCREGRNYVCKACTRRKAFIDRQKRKEASPPELKRLTYNSSYRTRNAIKYGKDVADILDGIPNNLDDY